MQKIVIALATTLTLLLVYGSCNKNSSQYFSKSEISDLESSDTIMTFTKSACFGRCPEIEVMLMGDKTLKYYGKRNVTPEGKYEKQISSDQIMQIYEWSENADFFHLESRYPVEGAISDAPTHKLGLKGKDSFKIVAFQAYAPDSVKTLFDNIDSFIMSQDWEAELPRR